MGTLAGRTQSLRGNLLSRTFQERNNTFQVNVGKLKRTGKRKITQLDRPVGLYPHKQLIDET